MSSPNQPKANRTTPSANRPPSAARPSVNATTPNVPNPNRPISLQQQRREEFQRRTQRNQNLVTGSLVVLVLAIGLIFVFQNRAILPTPATNTPVAGACTTIKYDSIPSPFPGVAITGQVQSLADCLKYVDLKVGTGTAVKSTDTITANYTGWTTDGKAFDSSLDAAFNHVQPAQFALSGVIPGWTKGIPGMKVGGIRRLIIPSALAYGTQGNQGIAPNSDLIFDVQIVSIP